MLVGYYVQGQSGRPIGEKTPAERQALALEQGGRIHPQYATEFENALLGGLAPRDMEQGIVVATPAATQGQLLKPQGRVYLAGDHLNLNAWMQGAFDSARQVATAIHARAGVVTRQQAR